MAGASVDDVFVIVLFSSFLALALGQSINAMTFIKLPIGLLTGILMGILISILLVKFFKRFHIRDTVKYLILLATSFVLVNIESYYGRLYPFFRLHFNPSNGHCFTSTLPNFGASFIFKIQQNMGCGRVITPLS